jgi:EAL domain-containing protein (putative c-di-GMP-specific phosphodiesterase class I)
VVPSEAWRSVIALGHALGLRVVAEGVETEQQLKFALQEGVEEIQGYFIGCPMPIEHFGQLVGRQQSVVSDSTSILVRSA